MSEPESIDELMTLATRSAERARGQQPVQEARVDPVPNQSRLDSDGAQAEAAQATPEQFLEKRYGVALTTRDFENYIYFGKIEKVGSIIPNVLCAKVSTLTIAELSEINNKISAMDLDKIIHREVLNVNSIYILAYAVQGLGKSAGTLKSLGETAEDRMESLRKMAPGVLSQISLFYNKLTESLERKLEDAAFIKNM